VEDDRDGRELLRRTLALCKAEAQTADCAATAYRMFMESRPDILISDIGMPDEDGYSLIRRIREYEAESRLPPTPAVALTAFARSEDRRRALRSGFQMHVSKPVVMSELLTVVSSLCGRM
jgi:CheY-like chemotaxis protein